MSKLKGRKVLLPAFFTLQNNGALQSRTYQTGLIFRYKRKMTGNEIY
jgi:hypothetical protein